MARQETRALNEPTRLINIDRLKRQLSEELPISQIAENIAKVELTQAGASQMKGRCPLHQEDTPSFYVNDAKQLYHCFGCKAGGDAISLVQSVRNCTFPEALYLMMAEAGIDPEQYERPLTDKEREAEKLRADMEAWLSNLPIEDSRQEVAAKHFGVRRCTPANRFRHSLLDDKDYLFRGTIFPMRSPSGRLLGWKTRTPDKKIFSLPKEFGMGTWVFGLHEAREAIRQTNSLILVEGEYDAMACWANGFHNVAAIGGSKFTDEQMQLLQDLHIPRLIFALDGDEAGRLAGLEIAKRWWAADIDISFARLPLDKDPEDLLSEQLGGLNFGVLISEAKGALEHLLFEEWMNRGNSMTDKLGFLQWISTNFGAQLSAAQETVVAQHVARWLEMPEPQVLDFYRVNKTPLQVVDSEQVVLSRCLRDRNRFRSIRDEIGKSDFYVIRHQRLWTVLEELLADDLEFESAVIHQKATMQGIDVEYLEELLRVNDENLEYHVEKVRDMAVRRETKAAADRFRERISDVSADSKDTIGGLTHQITQVALGIQREGQDTIKKQVDAAMEQLHERMKNPNSVHGLAVGSQFPKLNQAIQGFQKGRLVLLAANSGVGKTTLALQWATSLAVDQSVPVDFISLENSSEELIFKMAAHISGVNASKISGGALEPNEVLLVEAAMDRIRKSPLHIYAPSGGITPNEFVLYARESKIERRTEVFVIDYVQLVSPEPGNREKRYEQLRDFGMLMKMRVARAMDTCVICPAQLNRGAKDKERPTGEDMGDAYDLTRTADVLFILTQIEDSSAAELWIDKNRQGPTGVLIPMEFLAAQQTFYEHGAERAPDYRIA